jgi:two-component system NarL family response regulator
MQMESTKQVSEQDTNRLRILIADDHPVVREGLASIIGRQPDMQVVAQARNGGEALQRFLAESPDLCLLDLRMPGIDGIEAIGAILAERPSARVIILTSFETQEDIYRAVQAGAKGYFLKDSPPEELIDCIRAVAAGGTWIPPAVGAKLAKRVTDQELTNREKEVLQALATGKSNKEIGVAYNISEATVKVHVTHILEKLKVGGRTEAINQAVKRGLVQMR